MGCHLHFFRSASPQSKGFHPLLHISITWGVLKNLDAQATPQTTHISISERRWDQAWVVFKAPKVTAMCNTGLQTTEPDRSECNAGKLKAGWKQRAAQQTEHKIFGSWGGALQVGYSVPCVLLFQNNKKKFLTFYINNNIYFLSKHLLLPDSC